MLFFHKFVFICTVFRREESVRSAAVRIHCSLCIQSQSLYLCLGWCHLFFYIFKPVVLWENVAKMKNVYDLFISFGVFSDRCSRCQDGCSLQKLNQKIYDIWQHKSFMKEKTWKPVKFASIFKVKFAAILIVLSSFRISYPPQKRWSEHVEYNFYTWFAFWLLPDLSRTDQKVMELTTCGGGGVGERGKKSCSIQI